MWLVRAFSCMHSELQWSHLHGVNVPTLLGFPLRNVAGAVGCNAASALLQFSTSTAPAQLHRVYQRCPGSTWHDYQGLLAFSMVQNRELPDSLLPRGFGASQCNMTISHQPPHITSLNQATSISCLQVNATIYNYLLPYYQTAVSWQPMGSKIEHIAVTSIHHNCNQICTFDRTAPTHSNHCHSSNCCKHCQLHAVCKIFQCAGSTAAHLWLGSSNLWLPSTVGTSPPKCQCTLGLSGPQSQQYVSTTVQSTPPQ